jgi:hypothetical protein
MPQILAGYGLVSHNNKQQTNKQTKTKNKLEQFYSNSAGY